MIKALVFDLGGVIIPFDFSRAYRLLEDETGLTVAEIKARIGATDLVQRFECGLVGKEEFVRQLTGQLGIDLTYNRFRDLWYSIFPGHTLIPDEFFARMGKRFRLVLLSNTNALHFERLAEDFPLLRHFDHWVLSYEVKAMKPDQAIYSEAIRHAQCRAGECFYTDDVLPYVEGGRRAGMDAEQFTDFDSLLASLARRGIA